MKRIATIVLSVAATFLTTGIASAQDHAVKVTVPFSFSVNSTYLPAGHYTIVSDLENPAKLIIRDSTNNIRAMNIGMNDASEAGQAGMLLFHHYGDQYFLCEIRFATPSQAIFFPASKGEMRARKQNREGGTAFVSAS